MRETIVVFGTGNYYNIYKDILMNKYNIIAFADNDLKKHNTYIEEKKVINPKELVDITYDKIFIASTYELEIENQLVNIGIDVKKIITSQEIIENWFEINKIENVRNKNKINLLFCIRDLSGGGAQKVLVDLLNNLDYNKYSVDLLCIFNQQRYLSQVNSNVNTFVLFRNEAEIIAGGNYIRRMDSFKLHRNFINGKYDVEISFLEGESTKIIAGAESNIRKIAWVHTNMQFNHWTSFVYRNLEEERNSYERFDKIVCDSKDVGKSIINMFNVDNNKIEIIHTIIQKDNIIKMANQEKVKLQPFTFCAVGRITKVKGIDRLINVHKRLIDENIIHNIIVVGEGNDRGKLEKLVKELGIQNTFKFMGFQENPYKYIKCSDAFILPSREEGLSTVICEAIIIGKAIVATNCSGVLELLGNNEFGIVIENSEDGIYNGMKKILLNDKIKQHYEILAQKKAQEFDNKKIIKEIEHLLSEEYI